MKKPVGVWLHTRENKKTNLESYPMWMPAEDIRAVTKKSVVPLGELKIVEVTIVHLRGGGVFEVNERAEDVVAAIEEICG
ncbi:MAG: hypothetical protein AAGI37_19730 [Planctomycetota bacterium]